MGEMIYCRGAMHCAQKGGWQSARTWELIESISIFVVLFLLLFFVKKDSLLNKINRSLPQREAGLMSGIILGDKTGFDKSFYESLKNSGLVHLVVVSGSNVMLLVGGLIEQTAMIWGRKRSILLGLTIGWWYVNLVGWEVPVLRAMLLVSIFYFAQLLGRTYSVWRALVLTITIMILGEVRVLISVSFWLSMVAYLAIVSVKTSEWQKAVWVSIWITPILAMVFGKISLISPITNLLVLGIVEVLTVMGVVGLIVGKIAFWWCIPLLKYLAMIVEWGGSVPVLQMRFNWAMLVGYYLILAYILTKNKIYSNH